MHSCSSYSPPKSVIGRRRRIRRPVSCQFRTSNWIFRERRIRRPLSPRNHVPNFMCHQQQIPLAFLLLLLSAQIGHLPPPAEFGVRFRAILGFRIKFSENLEFDVRFRPGTTCRISCATSSRSPLAFLLLLLSAQVGHLPPLADWASDFVGI